MDIYGEDLPQIKMIACNYNSTFALDIMGQPYSWGKGFIGHEGSTVIDIPRKIEINTENRIFTNIFANEKQTVLYAPIRVFEITPKCGPSSGETLL